ncbi:hypothetical protein NQ318_000080 [Aromia moschata]|uniref:C2H2-type domain-containing protein n=1 Tax=Aromia moschata TaxID=1265417 RepID=A0AAV8YAC5_9CUCU|nr:hypothetical protein NQ318_000080 [Aromia moschata]
MDISIKEEKLTICNMCLECGEDNYILQDSEIKRKLDVVLAYPNKSMNQEIMCNKCRENLEICYDFKSSCIDTETCIKSTYEEIVDVNLVDVYLIRNEHIIEQNNTNETKNQLVCRLCLELIEYGQCVKLGGVVTSDAELLKIVLDQFFPEVIEEQDDATPSEICDTLEYASNIEIKCETESDNLDTVGWCHRDGFISGEELKQEYALEKDYNFPVKSEEIDFNLEENVDRDTNDQPTPCLSPNSSNLLTSPYQLPDCGTTQNKYPLEQSVNQHTHQTYYHCEKCKFKTSHKRNLRVHQAVHKNESQITMHQCEICQFKTRYKRSLKVHIASHRDTSKNTLYDCEFCEFKTKSKYQIKSHQLVHKDEFEVEMYRCQECEYKTRHKRCLKSHVAFCHEPEVTLYQCQRCEFKTKRKTTLKRHTIRLHQEESDTVTHQCQLCDYKSKDISYLKSHMLSHLDDEAATTYQCDICEYRTKRKGGLAQHRLIHKPESEVLMYQCDLCEYKSKYKSYLKQHKVVHEEGKAVTMFQCEMCEFKTKRKYNLYKHMVIHKDESEVTMYQCKECGYRSKRKNDLKKHILRHKGGSKIRVRTRKE